MTAQETIKKYFSSVHSGGWEDFVADDIQYVFNDMNNVMTGKDIYLQRAGQFYGYTTSGEIKQILTDGDEVALIASYNVNSPDGKSREFSVAEFYTVNDDRLASASIFFDMQSFGEFMGKR